MCICQSAIVILADYVLTDHDISIHVCTYLWSFVQMILYLRMLLLLVTIVIHLYDYYILFFNR